jgi:oligopeptide/dipeptide ABC transporter ATP-binding protein
MAALVEVMNLKKYFETPRGMLHAVDDVSFSIEEGKTMGIVGESGCGKSTLGRTMIHLLDSTSGSIYFDGEDVTIPNRRKLRKLRENMKIIFQDPYSSLNPRMTVEQTIMEPLIISGSFTRKERREETERLMEMAGIDQRFRLSYPHELSGGQRQRVGVARALALHPKFIVCDEPVSSLDISVQAQFLNLLQDLQAQYTLTYMFITHDLSVVRHISDDICVMYLGQLVETSPSKELFKHPLHPYTQALISAMPSIDIHRKKERIILEGETASPIHPKPHCRFAKRCEYMCRECLQPQRLEEILPKHFVACCRVREINDV